MSTFLPPDYQAPKADSKYLRINDGDNIRLRILSAPLIFWQYWTNDKKPVRHLFVPGDVIPPPPKNVGEDKVAKFVWALKIFNYASNSVEIWEISQKGIQTKLTDWNKDTDFGDPTTYDIKVARKGKDKGTTTYSVDALMKKENMTPMLDDILAEAKKIDLNALLTGDDPFKWPTNEEEFDPLA